MADPCSISNVCFGRSNITKLQQFPLPEQYKGHFSLRQQSQQFCSNVFAITAIECGIAAAKRIDSTRNDSKDTNAASTIIFNSNTFYAKAVQFSLDFGESVEIEEMTPSAR